MPAPIPLATLNDLDQGAFARALGEVFEHSPWVAARAWARRPFASVAALHAAMMDAVRSSRADDQLALIRAHPELAGREAAAGTLTADSTSEQGRLGFTALARAEVDRVARVNRAYREKFDFPCIVALRLHATRDAVLAEMERRVDNDRDTEIAAALDQIGHITRGRLDQLVIR